MYKEVTKKKYQKILDAMFAYSPLAQSVNVFTCDMADETLWIPSKELCMATTDIVRETCGTIDQEERNQFVYSLESDEVYMMIGKFTAEYNDEMQGDDSLLNNFIEDLMRYIVVAGTIMY